MTKNPVMQDDGQFHELADLLHEQESAYRYRSAESARRAGTSDALQCARFEGSDVSVSYPELSI